MFAELNSTFRSAFFCPSRSLVCPIPSHVFRGLCFLPFFFSSSLRPAIALFCRFPHTSSAPRFHLPLVVVGFRWARAGVGALIPTPPLLGAFQFATLRRTEYVQYNLVSHRFAIPCTAHSSPSSHHAMRSFPPHLPESSGFVRLCSASTLRTWPTTLRDSSRNKLTIRELLAPSDDSDRCAHPPRPAAIHQPSKSSRQQTG